MTLHAVTTLSDMAPNGWEDMQLHKLTQIMRQRDIEFAECLNNICRLTPKENSAEDILLQNCELHVKENDIQYPCDAMHVYAWNKSCDEWNEQRLHMLDGRVYESIALDSKRDDCTQLATLHLTKQNNTIGNLRSILRVKKGARVMLTTNIDVSEGLINGAMGIIIDIILDEHKNNIRVILIQFDNCIVGKEARINSTYRHINLSSMPISKVKASAGIHGHTCCQGSQTQFLPMLAWAVSIHKCQGLTLDEIVVDMTPAKGQFASGQAYVAFS